MTHLLIYDPSNGEILEYQTLHSTPAQEAALVANTVNCVECPIQPSETWLKNASIDLATKNILGLPASTSQTTIITPIRYSLKTLQTK